MSQRRHRLALLLSLAPLVCTVSRPAWAAKNEDEAVEEPAAPVGAGVPRRTLAERVPSVSHRAFTKAGRLELMPALGLSLSDPFYRYMMPGAGISYYVSETLAIGVSGEYHVAFHTPVPVSGGAVLPEPAFNKPVFAARLEVAWSPLYGKISWLAETVLHFDTYLSVGAGVVGPQTGSASPAASIAIGQHYFFNRWMAFRAELREEAYRMARNPLLSKDTTLQSFLTASAGLCFYFPQDIEAEDM